MISPREFPPQPREAGFVLYEDSFLKRQAQCHLPIFNAGCRAAARGSTQSRLSTGFMRRCLDEKYGCGLRKRSGSAPRRSTSTSHSRFASASGSARPTCGPRVVVAVAPRFFTVVLVEGRLELPPGLDESGAGLIERGGCAAALSACFHGGIIAAALAKSASLSCK